LSAEKQKEKSTLHFKEVIGSGSESITFVLIEGEEESSFATGLSEILSESGPDSLRILLFTGELPEPDQVQAQAERLSEELREKFGVLRSTLLGIGEGSLLAQAMLLANKKRVRKLILLGGKCHPLRSGASKLLDSIDSLSPFGLPLRVPGNDFDSRPFLHKIDCPVLLIDSESHGLCSGELKKGLPSAWQEKVENEKKLAELILEFSDVPARSPQKNKAL